MRLRGCLKCVQAVYIRVPVLTLWLWLWLTSFLTTKGVSQH